MTMSMNLDLPESMTPDLRDLLEGLLQREVESRLCCKGRGAQEIKEHQFFAELDWQQVYLQKYAPPIIPPRGEVNAADAFDIGSFDEEDTKGIKLTEADQELYKNFPLVVSDRWQAEICETVFEVVNQETDRLEQKRRQKSCGSSLDHGDDRSGTMSSVASTDCIVEGEISKLGGPFMQTWQKKHLKLFPNRLEFYNKNRENIVLKGVELLSMLDIREIAADFVRMNKSDHCIFITLKNDTKMYLTSHDRLSITQFKEEILNGFHLSNLVVANMNRKALKMYGTDVTDKNTSQGRQLHHSVSVDTTKTSLN